MKLCFSTLGCADYSLDAILETARQFGIRALEIRGIDGVLDNGKIAEFLPENTEETKRAFANAGVRPLVLGTSCCFHDEERLAAALAEGTRAVEIAAAVGFPYIRVFGNVLKGEPDACIRRVAEGILSLCRVAEGTGVKVLLEVHGDFNTAETLRPVAEHCKASPAFGLIWDVCHTRHTYDAEWRRFYDTFAPYICHVHLKDIAGSTHVLPGEGELPLTDMVRYMTEQGYVGSFSLEWERKWHPQLPPIEEALAAYVSLFADHND